jgi:hypothetical protein
MVVIVVAVITVVDVVISYANKGPYLSCLLHYEGISWHSLSDAQQFFLFFQMAKKCTFFANICDTFSKNTIDVVVNIYEVERTVFFDS